MSQSCSFCEAHIARATKMRVEAIRSLNEVLQTYLRQMEECLARSREFESNTEQIIEDLPIFRRSTLDLRERIDELTDTYHDAVIAELEAIKDQKACAEDRSTCPHS